MRCGALFLFFLLLARVNGLEAGGPDIATDDPFYPGLGKFRDVKAIVEAAYADAGNPQDNTGKAVALWKWMLLHLYHSSSRPLEVLNCLEPKNEEASACYDTMKFLATYGFAICYASASAMCGLFEAAGFPARARGVSGHTVPECFFDDDWHYLDHDMCGVAFEKDQKTLASVDELLTDNSLINWDYRSVHNIPQFPWDGGPGSKTMRGAFTKKIDDAAKYYDAGVAVHPTVFMLRRGESFTRFFNYDLAPWGNKHHWTGLTKNEKYFPTGPSRNVTFVFDPPVDGKNDGYPRAPYVPDKLARYGNGLFEYAPDLAAGVYREGAEVVKNIEDGGSPKVKGGKGGGEIVFRQWSPFAIAGAPENADPWAKVSDAVVVSGKAAGDGVKVAVSSNNGLSWDERAVAGAFAEDFSMLTRGRYTYLVRFMLPEGAGLDELVIRTVTMCAPSMMPHLHDGANAVAYSCRNLGVVFVEPDFSSKDFCERSWQMTGLGFDGSNDMRPCPVRGGSGAGIMKVSAPGKIVRVAAYAMISSSSPPRQNYIVSLQVSPDGQQWKDMMRKALDTNAQHWRHWIAADVPVDYGKRELFVKVQLDPGGNPGASVCRTGAYAYYETSPPPEVEVEHVWKEGGVLKSAKRKVKAGASDDKYSVSCGSNVTNVSVKMSVANNAAVAEATAQPGTTRSKPGSKTAGDKQARAEPPDPEKKAAVALDATKNLYLKSGMIDEAKKRLRRIMDEYPGTKAAEEAKALLDGL